MKEAKYKILCHVIANLTGKLFIILNISSIRSKERIEVLIHIYYVIK